MSKFKIITVLFFSIAACGIRAGNRISLDYAIDTKLDQDVIKRYLDTLILNYGFTPPKQLLQFDKLIDITPETTRRIYFEQQPKEMYLIQFNGVLLIADVYNSDIVADDYVSRRERMPRKEEVRIKNRFKTEVLDRIEAMAKKDGVADSVLYFKVKW
jgi:hypothetical protein